MTDFDASDLDYSGEEDYEALAELFRLFGIDLLLISLKESIRKINKM